MKKLLLLACIVFSAPIISEKHGSYFTEFLLPVPETVNAPIESLKTLDQTEWLSFFQNLVYVPAIGFCSIMIIAGSLIFTLRNH